MLALITFQLLDPEVRVGTNQVCQGSLIKFWGGYPCDGLASHSGGLLGSSTNFPLIIFLSEF